MKNAIHPKYEKTTIKCACGNEIETKSTVFPEIHTELCSACHPFFTGKQKFVDTAGRVDKFRARMEAASAKEKVKTQSTKEEKPASSNAEKLAEMKDALEKVSKPHPASIEARPKPEVVTQEASSDVEIAAAEELEEAKDNQ